MSSPLEQAGATREPSEYAALSMDRGITGLWTQRSPLRDADVPYLYGKFYSASRFDSLIDGVNRELTAKLTWRRRPGSSIYNSDTFPGINSFYSYKRIVAGAEIVRVIADAMDGKIYDATAGQKSAIFTKGTGAGKARFQGVNTALYFADGVENEQWLQPGPWVAQTSLATTQYAVGTTVIDPNGKLEYLSAVGVGNITNVALAGKVAQLTFNNTNFNVSGGMAFTPAGLTGASFLNGQLLVALSVVASGATYIVTAFFDHASYASAADSGTASTMDVGTLATTGGSIPTWNGTVGGTTADGLSTWINFGGPVFNWGPPLAPLTAPSLSRVTNNPTTMYFWKPFTLYAAGSIIVDAGGFIQIAPNSGNSGGKLPLFVDTTGGSVVDGQITWTVLPWLGTAQQATGWASDQAMGGLVIVDPNGNLQLGSGGGVTGATIPTFNQTYGLTTADNGNTWTNAGPYLALAFQGFEYGYGYHCIDGSVSTLSPLTQSTNGVIDGVGVTGNYSTSSQVDSVWIFRTADGESTPLFLASIPNNQAGGTWEYNDQNSDFILDGEIPGPQGESNNPPPVGMTAPVYHLGRIAAIYQNGVIMSGGPDTIVGNGNTAFSPASFYPIPEQPIRLFSFMTSAGPALLIWGRANIYSILGQGTANNPFQQASVYMAGCGIQNYDAVTQIGSTFYAFGNTALVGGNLVGKAFSLDPAAGYVEFGFPIGDQFTNVTTGAGGKIPNSGIVRGWLYNPASTFVTWAELGSGDTALYVADGTYGWFRYSPVASPESGFLWSPRAAIVGGTTAVQGIETQPGVTQLLIGPEGTGPILFRDSTVSQDWWQGLGGYQSYPSYDVKGCIQLCLSGEVGEVAHVHLVSMPVGAKPSVGLLFGEILPTAAAPFAWFDPTCSEPPNIPKSQSVYSDRYTMLSKGVTPKCLFFQLGMDYGTQNAADETLMFSVYGAKYGERKQQ